MFWAVGTWAGRRVDPGCRDPGSEIESCRRSALEELVRKLLHEIGEDPSREGLVGTPERVGRAMRFLTRGYAQDVDELLNGAYFEVDYDEMVIVKDIEVYSLCEHHLLPFFGRCHVGYLPSDRVIGLSKIPRIVDVFARRLQVQERLTQQIAETVNEKIRPKGVAVVVEAQHLCMLMRGVEKRQTRVMTSAMLGKFRDDQRSRSEFLHLVGARKT